MELKYLWDTNTVIYFLQQQLPPSAEEYVDNLLKESDPTMSVITEIELLCWKTRSEEDMHVVHNFIKDAHVIGLETEIKAMAAEIRKAYRTKLPDAVIASTVIVYELKLLRRNVSDFKAVEGLELINPYDQ